MPLPSIPAVSKRPIGTVLLTNISTSYLSLLPSFLLSFFSPRRWPPPTPPSLSLLFPFEQFAAPGFVLKSFLKGQREMVSRWETGGGEWRASEKGATPRERALLRHGCRTSRAATFDPDTKIGRVICDLCNISRFGILTPAFQTRI